LIFNSDHRIKLFGDSSKELGFFANTLFNRVYGFIAS